MMRWKLLRVHSSPMSKQIMAYLDDVYITAGSGRIRVYDLGAHEIHHRAGIEINKDKSECWCSGGGVAPPGIAELNGPAPIAPVWKGDLAPEFNGLEILGSSVGDVLFQTTRGT